jgi:peroxiredoxin Q/BCP
VKKFEKLGAVVLGISADTIAKQKSFEEKHKLGVPLLSDEDKSVLTKYGIYGEKKMHGRTVMGIKRTTLLIDAKGNVVKRWNNVRADGHAAKVLEELSTLV